MIVGARHRGSRALVTPLWRSARARSSHQPIVNGVAFTVATGRIVRHSENPHAEKSAPPRGYSPFFSASLIRRSLTSVHECYPNDLHAVAVYPCGIAAIP